jgi:hypothetical protein
MRTRRLQFGSWIGAVLVALPSAAIEGRYQGAVSRVEGAGEGDAMRHLYEISGRRTLSGGLDFRLHASLRYQSRLPVRDTDLLRSRLLAELRATQWRVDAQFVPWQRNVVTRIDSRERQSILGVHWTPRRGPQVDAAYDRLDREVGGVRSAYDDRRLRTGWERNGYGAEATVRRIDARTNSSLGAAQRTDQWTGRVHAERSWATVTTGGEYEGVVSKYRVSQLRRTTQSQRAQGRASWTPDRRVSATTTILERWTTLDDNSLRASQSTREHGLTAAVDVRPVFGLNVQALREYRRQDGVGADVVVDYLQLLTNYRHDVWRRVELQTGWTAAVQFAGATGEAPRSSAYGTLDGRLRPGLEARAEVRASRVRDPNGVGTQWHELAEVRTRPTRFSRVDIAWRRESLPPVNGAGQTEREWQVRGSYEPSPSVSIGGSWRRLAGEGRIRRHERLTGVTANWRLTRRVSVAANGQWRRTRGMSDLGSDRALGMDASFDLATGTRMRANVRESRAPLSRRQRSYGLIVEKNF